MIAKMLDLSTAHMPNNEPGWGDVRVEGHESGWIVFVCSDREAIRGVPKWLLPTWTKAVAEECILINFDCDADEDEDLPSWDW